MSFLSLNFFLFFPIAVLGYYLSPYRFRKFWLAAAGLVFYSFAGIRFVPLLFGYVLFTYFAGIALEKRAEKPFLAVCLVLLFTILGLFKYVPVSVFSVMPAGISFFTFEAAGYLIDIYRGKYRAERNFLNLLLFLSFFPQLLSGPIARGNLLLPQIKNPRKFRLHNLRSGIYLLLWGAFLKLVIADRAALFVDALYGNYETHGGAELLLAAILYAIQIYCDFSGYSVMALGTAQILGFRLQDNFEAPYLAPNISELWRRWHISLTSWFRDYLYIPLGGNRRGTARKYLNIMIVFVLSGMWHGNTLNFAIWGALNGLYLLISGVTKPLRRRARAALGIDPASFSCRFLSCCIVFAEFTFSCVFFRAESLSQALGILRRIFTCVQLRGLGNSILFRTGDGMPGRGDLFILLAASAVLFAADCLKYRGIRVRNLLMRQDLWFRDLVVIGSFLVVLFLGVWGESFSADSFVYVHF